MAKVWIFAPSGTGTGDLQRQLDDKATLLTSTLSAPVKVAEVWAAGSKPNPGDSAIYLGVQPSWDTTLEDPKFWRAYATVLPVIPSARGAKNLPSCLAGINALIMNQIGTGWQAAAADEVFSRTMMPRSVRRVFISYKRDESRGVARQLSERLSRDGLDVFLDEVSIPRAECFAREIRLRLLDSDIVIVLWTAGVERSTSPWVAQELRLAAVHNVARLVVLWPGVRAPRLAWPDELEPVSPSVPSGGKNNRGLLRRADLQKVVTRVHEMRIGAVAARVNTLLPAAKDDLEKRNPLALVRNGRRLGELISESGPDVNEVVAVVAGRPTIDIAFRVCRENRDPAPGRVRIVHQRTLPNDLGVHGLRWAFKRHQPAIEVEDV